MCIRDRAKDVETIGATSDGESDRPVSEGARVAAAYRAHKKEVLIDAVLELGGEAVKLPDDA